MQLDLLDPQLKKLLNSDPQKMNADQKPWLQGSSWTRTNTFRSRSRVKMKQLRNTGGKDRK